MLLTVGSALDLMFLTPFVAMFCLQIIKPRMYFYFIELESSVSTVQQIFFVAFNHIKFQAK